MIYVIYVHIHTHYYAISVNPHTVPEMWIIILGPRKLSFWEIKYLSCNMSCKCKDDTWA